MDKHKRIGEIYWVLLDLKQEFDNTDNTDFYKYAHAEIKKLTDSAIEWMAEDERDLVDNLWDDG